MTIRAAWYEGMTDDIKPLFMDEMDDKWRERACDLDEQLSQTIDAMEPKQFLEIRKIIKKDWGVTWGILDE